MISYRQSDILNRIKKQQQDAANSQAYKDLLRKKGVNKLYEYKFDDVVVDGMEYSGELNVIYSADFIPGDRSIGESPHFEVQLGETTILPGEVFDENIESIYDPIILAYLADKIGEIIGEDAISEAIEERLMKDDGDPS